MQTAGETARRINSQLMYRQVSKSFFAVFMSEWAGVCAKLLRCNALSKHCADVEEWLLNWQPQHDIPYDTYQQEFLKQTAHPPPDMHEKWLRIFSTAGGNYVHVCRWHVLGIRIFDFCLKTPLICYEVWFAVLPHYKTLRVPPPPPPPRCC